MFGFVLGWVFILVAYAAWTAWILRRPIMTWNQLIGGVSVRVVQRWFRLELYVAGHLVAGCPIHLRGDTRLYGDGVHVIMRRSHPWYGPDPGCTVEISGGRIDAGLETDLVISSRDLEGEPCTPRFPQTASRAARRTSTTEVGGH